MENKALPEKPTNKRGKHMNTNIDYKVSWLSNYTTDTEYKTSTNISVDIKANPENIAIHAINTLQIDWFFSNYTVVSQPNDTIIAVSHKTNDIVIITPDY